MERVRANTKFNFSVVTLILAFFFSKMKKLVRDEEMTNRV